MQLPYFTVYIYSISIFVIFQDIVKFYKSFIDYVKYNASNKQ